MARKAVGVERSSTRKQLDQVMSQFEEKNKALVDEKKAAEKLWNQERFASKTRKGSGDKLGERLGEELWEPLLFFLR